MILAAESRGELSSRRKRVPIRKSPIPFLRLSYCACVCVVSVCVCVCDRTTSKGYPRISTRWCRTSSGLDLMNSNQLCLLVRFRVLQ